MQAVIAGLPKAVLPDALVDDEAKPKKKRKKTAETAIPASDDVAPTAVPDPGDEAVELNGEAD